MPISVCIPVAVTTACADPYVMEQPENTMFERSPIAASAATTASASFSVGTDSPVSADSSDLSDEDDIRRASAGTKSPASNFIMSPGTRSEAAMIFSVPSLITRACGADMFLSASSAFSALFSCTTPIIALRMTISRIRAGSKNSVGSCPVQAITKEIMAAMIRIIIMTSLNWSINLANVDFFFFSFKTLRPYCCRRCCTSASLRPFCGCVLSSSSVCAEDLSK